MIAQHKQYYEGVNFLSIASQYWQLIRVLFFNFKVFGCLLVIFSFLAVVSGILGLVFPIFKLISEPVVFLALFLFLFVGVISFPMGMLSILANKQICLMPGIREKLFVIVCGFCMFFSVVIPILCDMGDTKFLLRFMGDIFLGGVLYFWLSLYLANKNFIFIGLTPFIAASQAKFYTSYLGMLHPITTVLASVFLWVAFYRWWIAFHPKRISHKSVLIESNPRKLQEIPYEKWFFLSSNRVISPIGSLLLGYGDGLIGLLKRFVLIFLMASLFSAFATGALKDGHFTESIFVAVLIALAYSFVITGADFLGQRMLINVKKCWLLFHGNRTDLFLFLERYCLRGIVSIALISVGVIIVLLLCNNRFNYFVYCFSGVAIFTLLLILNFYTSIYFFEVKKIFPGEINFPKMIISIVLFLPPVVYLVVKYEKAFVFEVRDFIAIVITLAMVVSFRTIRHRSLKQWLRTDF